MSTPAPVHNRRVSSMAETLIGSEIIGLAAQVRRLIQEGRSIHNLTIGDFDSTIFPIPDELTAGIDRAYRAHQTNYPPAEGIRELRLAVSVHLREEQGLDYDPDLILVGAGARPLIYATFATLVDPGERVVFPVPSWNNNHYAHLFRAVPVGVEVQPETRFLPTAADLQPHLAGAALLTLCSPLNPAGTTFTAEQLGAICDLVLAENARRGPSAKPLYVLYDQVYSALVFDGTMHVDPVSLRPAMRDCTVYIDGISKSLAATGVRVGWACGPEPVMARMKSILSHVGAWAPRAEQIACAEYLGQRRLVAGFFAERRQVIGALLDGFYDIFAELKDEGHRVEAIAPEGAIYLTVKLDLVGKRTAAGRLLATTKDVQAYLLEEAHVALVPFTAFGSRADLPWWRLSVGTATAETIAAVRASLGAALRRLR